MTIRVHKKLFKTAIKSLKRKSHLVRKMTLNSWTRNKAQSLTKMKSKHCQRMKTWAKPLSDSKTHIKIVRPAKMKGLPIEVQIPKAALRIKTISRSLLPLMNLQRKVMKNRPKIIKIKNSLILVKTRKKILLRGMNKTNQRKAATNSLRISVMMIRKKNGTSQMKVMSRSLQTQRKTMLMMRFSETPSVIYLRYVFTLNFNSPLWSLSWFKGPVIYISIH